jgi:hypothetical protein
MQQQKISRVHDPAAIPEKGSHDGELTGVIGPFREILPE